MTTYTTITNALVAVGAKPFATTIQALRDNPIAIAEGDATAPSILPAIANKSAAGGVGTYAFARRTTGTADVSFGSTLAGSDLSPTSASAIVGPGLGGTNAATLSAGSALSGTWRCMGTYDHTVTSTVDGSSNSQTIGGATIWLRIS